MSNLDFVFVGIKSEPDFFTCEETEIRGDSYVDTKIKPEGGKPSEYETNIKQEEINEEDAITVYSKSNAAKLFACSSCEFKTCQKTKLIKHAPIHMGEKQFACYLCSFKSANKYTFKVHMKFHKGERLRRCDLCEFRAITKYHLIAHMKCHTVFKPKQNMKQNSFRCHLCKFTVYERVNISIHMRAHSMEQFACNLCKFKTKNESVWKHHMKLHYNLSTFKIVQSTNLTKHVEVHTEQSASEFKHAKIQRLFTCNSCEFQSSRKDKLIAHMEIHSEEKQPLQKLGEFKTNEKNNAKYRVRVLSVEKSIGAHST